MEALDLYFMTGLGVDPDFDWSLVENFLFTGLGTFKIASDRPSPNVTIFCDLVLQNCSSTENLKLSGLTITDDFITQLSLRSLKSFDLKYRHNQSVWPTYIRGERGKAPIERGVIHWSTIKVLLRKNPAMEILHLNFDLTLGPFALHDMKEISMSNRELNHIYIEYEDPDISSPITPEGFLDCSWFYVKSSKADNFHHDIVKKIIKAKEIDIHHQEFVIYLNRLRWFWKGNSGEM